MALPSTRELPATHRPYIVLLNRTLSAISELYASPSCIDTARFRAFLSDILSTAHSLLPTFHAEGSPFDWLPLLGESLVCHRMREQHEVHQRRKTAWRAWIKDTWALNSKKVYQLVKGKFVEPFTCLQSEGQLVTDRQQIDQLLQHAWNSIFAKYGTDENKADDYRNSFYPTDSPFSTVSFPKLTLEDLHYVLSKKLKNNTATGLDGWRPSEIKQLPDCLLLALLDVYNLCEPKATFLLSSTIPILLLFLKDYRVLRLVFVLLQFFLSHSPIPYLR